MAFAKSLKTRNHACRSILTCPQCESVVRRYCPGSTPLAALPLRLNRRRPDGSAASTYWPQPRPLDAVADENPIRRAPTGRPVSLDRAPAAIHAAVPEAKKLNWKMSVAAAGFGANLVAFGEWMA